MITSGIHRIAQVHQHLYDWLLLRKCLDDSGQRQTRILAGWLAQYVPIMEDYCGGYHGFTVLKLGDDGAPTSEKNHDIAMKISYHQKNHPHIPIESIHHYPSILFSTSSTAQGGGGSFRIGNL